MVLGGIAVIAFGGSDKPKKIPHPEIIAVPPATIGAVDPAQQKTATVATATPTPTPTTTIATAPLPLDAEKVADDELTVVLRFEGVPAGNFDERMKRLDDFIAHHGDSRAATHAQAILSDLRSDAVLKKISDVAVTTTPTTPSATAPATTPTPAPATGENPATTVAPPVAQPTPPATTPVVDDTSTKPKAPDTTAFRLKPRRQFCLPPPQPSTPERKRPPLKE